MNEDVIVDELHQFCGDCTDLKSCIIRKHICRIAQRRIDEDKKLEHVADMICDDMFYNAGLHP